MIQPTAAFLKTDKPSDDYAAKTNRLSNQPTKRNRLPSCPTSNEQPMNQRESTLDFPRFSWFAIIPKRLSKIISHIRHVENSFVKFNQYGG